MRLFQVKIIFGTGKKIMLGGKSVDHNMYLCFTEKRQLYPDISIPRSEYPRVPQKTPSRRKTGPDDESIC